jgi:hypothetical protein
MEKTKKHKKNRDGSQDPQKSGEGKGQVLVDVPASTGVSMDFAKNMKSAAVELKRMSITNSQPADLRPKPPASPRGEAMHAAPQQSSMERQKQLWELEQMQQQMQAQKSPRGQQQQQPRPPSSPQPEQQQYNVRGQIPSQQARPPSSNASSASPVPTSKGQAKQQQKQHKQVQQLQGQVAGAASLAHTNGHFGRGPSYDSLQGFSDMGALLDGMTCPSCGNIKGMERMDLCQLRDAAEELRSQLADLSLQFAKEQTRDAAECKRLRGLLEGDPRYKDEFNASKKQQKGNNADVQELKSELSELKRRFQSEVADLKKQLSAEEAESQRLRDKLQREEMRRGR